MNNDPFPRMLRVRQQFAVPPTVDVRAALREQWGRLRPRIKPGARIAVAVGSRGITQLEAIVATLVELLQAANAQVFIVPAMGSHGGGTPEGQQEILAAYGITEARLRVPVQAAMETMCLGTTDDGFPVHFSTAALQADGVIVVNRVKPHTDFTSETLGSGLLKMLVVGLGKRAGAANSHATASRIGYEHLIRTGAKIVLQSVPVLGGVAIVENQVHAPARIAVLPAEELEGGEPELFAEAKRLMPQLPLDEIDLLIVDRIGKNISGTGMDTGVIGRGVHGYAASLGNQWQARPFVRRLFVRDLTPETQGNGIGIGLADFTTTRLVQALDSRKTYLNVLTSLSLSCAKIPIHFATDREVLRHALNSLALRDSRQATVVRIADTLSLEHLEVAESCAGRIQSRPDCQVLAGPVAMDFGPDDNLRPLAVPAG